MKYRIVQLKNIEYLVQRKRRWYDSWDTVAYPPSLSRAKELMGEIISDAKKDELREKGRKIDKIIEEFEV